MEDNIINKESLYKTEDEETKELLYWIVTDCREIIEYLNPEDDFKQTMQYFKRNKLNIENKDLRRIAEQINNIWVDVLYGSLNN